MRRLMLLALLSLLALVPIGISSPTEGSRSTKPEVDAKGWKTRYKFHGGERACVLAFHSSDQQKAPVHLHLIVVDLKSGSIVGEDKSSNKLVGDYVGVVWYPPRTGDYEIELRHPGSERVTCYLAIK